MIGLLDERLLLGGVLFEVRLEPEEQVLVNQRFHVVGFDLEGVIDRLDALLHELAFFVLLQLEIAIRLVPVVR